MSESDAPPLIPASELRPDELALRILYARLATVQVAAGNHQQRRHLAQARYRTTAGLVALGWRVPEIAVAAGTSNTKVQYWLRCGRQLDHCGLSLPPPLRTSQAVDSQLLGVPEVARRLRVNESTIRRWIKDGLLPARRPSGDRHARWVIEEATLNELGLDGPLLTVQEVAEQYNVSPLTIRLWIHAGRLQGRRVPGTTLMRVPQAALTALRPAREAR